MPQGNYLHFCTILLLMTLGVESNFEIEALAQSSTCHIEWDPTPCNCYEIYDSPYLVCKNLRSTEELAGIFDSLHTKIEFNEFRLKESNVTVLTKGIFGNASFQGFQIHDNSLESVERGAFQGSESTAKGIVFMKNKISNLDFNFVRDLTNLQVLIVSYEKITEIPESAFVNAAHLAKIEFTHNPVSTIGQRAFANINPIKTIVVKDCTVTVQHVGDQAFFNPTAQHLESIVFRNNNVSKEALSSTSFSGINAPLVDLQHNNFGSITEAVFDPLLQAMSSQSNGIILGFGNPLKCDHSMKWLMKHTRDYKKPLVGFQCENGKSVVDLKEADLV